MDGARAGALCLGATWASSSAADTCTLGAGGHQRGDDASGPESQSSGRGEPWSFSRLAKAIGEMCSLGILEALGFSGAASLLGSVFPARNIVVAAYTTLTILPSVKFPAGKDWLRFLVVLHRRQRARMGRNG